MPEPTVPLDDRSDEELLRDAAAGDAEAFISFCTSRLSPLRSFAAYLCRRYDVPEDLVDDFVQATLLRVLKRMRGGEPMHLDSPYPYAYLKAVCRNLVVDWHRQEHKHSQVSLEAAEAAARPPHAGAPTAHQYLSWLPESQAKILQWFLIDNLDGREVAAKLGISRDAAYQRYRRALDHLRALVELHDEWKQLSSSPQRG